jgi:hypothetical protein
MIALIKGWIAARKELQAKRDEERGYAWAQGELRRGTRVEVIEAQIENGEFFDGRNPFDEGARKALEKV